MAIRPVIKYPGQVQPASGAYPHGKAQNVTVVGDGTGTPLEKDWVNDLWGFLQSLLSTAGVTPSGNPDEVGASDYLTAMRGSIRSMLTPAQITSAQNNYGPAGFSEATIVRVSSNSLQPINGFDSSAKVKTKLVINVGANGIQLPHLAGGQGAGNAIIAPSSVTYLLGPGDSALIDCDTTTGAWRIVGGASLAASRAWGGAHSWTGFLMSGGVLSGSGSIDIDGSCETSRFIIDHGSNEWDYKVARARAKILPFNFVTDNPSSNTMVWAPLNGIGAYSLTAGTSILYIDLPTGAVITGIFAGVTPDGSGVITLSARSELFPVLSGTIINTPLGTPAATSGGGYQLLDLGAMSVPVNNQLTRYSVSLQASAILQSCHGIYVAYNDPGPRSF